MRKQLLYIPDIIPAELLIQSRDHIPLMAACCTGSLKYIQALYGQVGQSKNIPRQMLSIAARRNRTDLAGYCLEQCVQLDTNDIDNILGSIIAGRLSTTCNFLVVKGMDINLEVEFMGDISKAANYSHLALSDSA